MSEILAQPALPRPTWDEWYIDIAKKWAERSKDPSTQCGSVIVRADKTECSTGYNGFPRRIADRPELLNDRPEKYRRVIHAEVNALLNAYERVNGYTLYVWPFMTCERCAVQIIQAGIMRVVAPAAVTEDQKKRWEESHALSMQLYQEAGVAVTIV